MDPLTPSEAAALRYAAAEAERWRTQVAARKVGPEQGYAEALARFSRPLPEEPADPEVILRELVAAAEPGLIGTVSPRFFGWVKGASHPVGVAADWLASAWGQNAALAQVTPSAAAAEEAATRWLLDLLDLPRGAGVGVTTGATMANAIAMAAARNALLAREGWDVEAKGLFGAPEITVIRGAEAHSTMSMGLRLIGFGADRVMEVATDDQGAMRAEAFEAALAAAKGPVLVLAQAGHINSGAFDPFARIVAAARARRAWVHVDGAFGLWARACPDRRALTDGIEGADSWATDGHKWLQVPYECGVVMVRDTAALARAMSAHASYLPRGEARDPYDFTPELSRRARGFALWATIRALGRSGVAEMVGRNCAVARSIAEGLRRVPGIEILNEVVLNQVAVATREGDAATNALLARVQAEGACFPSGGVWKGRSILRISVSSGRTGPADGARLVEAITAAWTKEHAV